jgi:hypothetical protein
VTELQTRFLRAIVAHVGVERIVDVHLFPSIRQGPQETGVAVVAAIPEGYVAPSAVAEPMAEAEPAAPELPAVRHVVYSARYRAVLKGPERGKWEVDVVAEADAPLVTVEAVVRGIRQRSSEAGDPERIDGDALRALLEAAWSQPA